jgi:hypothetical protein
MEGYRMATRAGVGYSENPHSKEAGIEAAKAAMAEAGRDTCDLVILYHTAKHDPRQFHEGVRSIVGPSARLIGGYAGGIITRDYLGYDGYQGGVAVLSSDTVKIEMFIEHGLKEYGEHEIGRRLGKQISRKRYDGEPGLIYMYDSVKSFSPTGGFDMNIGTYLLEGLTASLDTWPSAAGMGMIGNIQFNPTFQFFDDQIVQQAAMALILHGSDCRLDTTVMHGCKPASDYHTVTKADRNVVLEIDGKPALDIIAKMLGPDPNRGWEDYPLFITLGVNKGEKFGEYKAEEYANRLCMAIDRERRGLVMFEPDLTPGTEIQLMRRSVDFEYIRERAQQLYDGLGSRQPFLGIYIDCMGRAASYCGSEGEEGAAIQQVIGSEMPLLGMYTGVELGAVAGQQQALDWSGVLCVFSE